MQGQADRAASLLRKTFLWEVCKNTRAIDDPAAFASFEDTDLRAVAIQMVRRWLRNGGTMKVDKCELSDKVRQENSDALSAYVVLAKQVNRFV